MKKHYLLLVVLSCLSLAVNGQSDRFRKKKEKPKTETESPKDESKGNAPKSEPRLIDRLVFGGGAGLGFGTNTNIFLAPQVGYKITEDWVAGVGYMYNYAKWNQIFTVNGAQNVDFENQIHGPNIFSNYTILDRGFVGAQLEVLNHDIYTYNVVRGDFNVSNSWTPVLFVQAGLSTPIGSKGSILYGLRLNVLHDANSPYASSWAPIVQFFF